MKKVLLALLLVALVAMPAAASVQNVKVGGDIESTFVVRNQFDLGVTTGSADKYRQNFLLTQTRLRVDADLTDNVQATVGLINERVWGLDDDEVNGRGSAADVGSNDIDLNLAFVTLREMLYSPLTVVLGRQNFAFGNSFVIDSAGTNNSVSTGGLQGVAEDLSKRTAQDAIRLILDYNPLTINLIASKIDTKEIGGLEPHKDDITLYGTNLAYQLGDKWQTSVEGYFWAKIDNSAQVVASTNHPRANTVYMPGIHVSTNPIKGLMVSAEIAMQRGNIHQTTPTPDLNLKREASAAQLIANYQVQCAKLDKYKPTVTSVYTYVSGDKDAAVAGDGYSTQTRHTAWDPMFENQAGGTIYNTMFSLSNAHIVTTKVTAMPMQDVTASAQWDNIWLDKRVSGGTITIFQPDNTSTGLGLASTTNRYLGGEFGFGLNYAYTEDVNLGAKFNWFMPGDAFSANNRNTASQILVNANVNF